MGYGVCVYDSYGHRMISRSAFCRRSDIKTRSYGSRRSPQILTGYLTKPVRCPYGVPIRSDTKRKAVVR